MNPNSTLIRPNSTVELGYKPLNWGENGTRGLQIKVPARSKPLGTHRIPTSFWAQTEIQPNQAGKFLSSTLDLGCLPSASLSFSLSIVPPSVGECRLVSAPPPGAYFYPPQAASPRLSFGRSLKTPLLQNEPNFIYKS